jgi:hypothetical protein
MWPLYLRITATQIRDQNVFGCATSKSADRWRLMVAQLIFQALAAFLRARSHSGAAHPTIASRVP